MVDLGPEPNVNRWDEAVIFGSICSCETALGVIKHDASALAEITGTVPYEITCNINKRVPRVYME